MTRQRLLRELSGDEIVEWQSYFLVRDEEAQKRQHLNGVAAGAAQQRQKAKKHA